MFNFKNLLTGVCLFASAGLSAQAGVILTTGDGPYEVQETRSPEFAILSYLQVGPDDVTIGGFGARGTIQADGNVKYAIFSGSATGGEAPLFVTDAQSVLFDGADKWYDSQSFTFTLLANESYYLGLISDQSFTYDWNSESPAVVSNGLTAVANHNGNASTFASPTYSGPGGVQQSIEIFDSSAPEPSTVVLAGAALIGMASLRRRFAR